MIDKSIPGDRAIRYYPIIDTDDTGRHKVALIPALSDAQLKRENPARTPAPPAASSSGNMDFEDRLKKFMQESDSRIADNRMYSEHRQRTRRK